MYQLPLEYKLSICEIKTLQNKLLSTGVISAIEPEYVEISGKTGAIPILPFREEVKLSIFNHKYGLRVLSALVYVSNPKFIRLFETQSILDYERRNFFRMETNISAEIQLFRNSDSKNSSSNHKVVVCNLSLGGTLIQTKLELKEEKVFQLHIPINGKMCIFTCVVHSAEAQNSGTWLCRCEFREYSDRQSDILCAYLFERQRIYLKNL